MKFRFVIRRIFLLLVGLSILGIFYFLQFRPHNLLPRDVQGESEPSYYRSILFDEIKERSGMVYELYDRKLRDFLTTYEPESWPNLTAAESYPSLIPEGLRITHPTPKYLPGTNISLPLLIVHPAGRFGNVMGKYATVFAIGKLYNVPIAMTTDMMVLLNETFPHLSTNLTFTEIFAKSNCIPLIGGDKHNEYPAFEVAAAGYFGRKCFNVVSYPFQMQLFNVYREEITKEFTFSDDIQREVLDYFSTIRRNLSQQDAFRDIVDPVFIGIHARRTDYSYHIKQLGGKLPGENFYKRAIQYYRQKFPIPIFVASSDSMKFIKKTLEGEPGVFFTPGESASVDMATLSSCNHSIFSLGTFGFWSSYLAGGEAVYANVKTNIPYRFSAPFYEEARITNFTPLNCDSD